jgi:hypothetical protein
MHAQASIEHAFGGSSGTARYHVALRGPVRGEHAPHESTWVVVAAPPFACRAHERPGKRGHRCSEQYDATSNLDVKKPFEWPEKLPRVEVPASQPERVGPWRKLPECLGGPANAFLSMQCRIDTRGSCITVAERVQVFELRTADALNAHCRGFRTRPVSVILRLRATPNIWCNCL